MLEDNEYIIIYEAEHTIPMTDIINPTDSMTAHALQTNPLVNRLELTAPYLIVFKLPDIIKPFCVYMPESRLDEYESMLHKIGCTRKKITL